jgi:hypothetical protein
MWTGDLEQEVDRQVRLPLLQRWVSQVFHEDAVPDRHPDTEQDEPSVMDRVINLMTPVEHDSLASLSSHIAATAKGEIFGASAYTENYAP